MTDPALNPERILTIYTILQFTISPTAPELSSAFPDFGGGLGLIPQFQYPYFQYTYDLLSYLLSISLFSVVRKD